MTHAALKDQKANAELALAKTAGGHLSHEEIADKVRMLMRMDLDHEAVCTMARDRIRWLAGRVAELEASAAALSAMEGEAVKLSDLPMVDESKNGDFPSAESFAATQPQQAGGDDRDRLVGSVLDAWEMLPNDVKCEVLECALGKQLNALLDWMENDQPVPAHVKVARAKRKSAHPTPSPGPQGGGEALATDEVLVAITRGEGYEDVAPELVAEDALGLKNPFQWRVVATPPARQSEGMVHVGWFNEIQPGSFHFIAGTVDPRTWHDNGKPYHRALLAAAPADAGEGCGCRACRPLSVSDMRMIVCATCGNKRCPHANDHRNECTNSNEPGQPGSAYPATQPERDGRGK